MRWEVTTLGQVVQLERNRNEDLKRIYLGLENIESDTGQIVGVTQCADDVSSAYAFEQDDVLYGRLRPYLNKVHLAKAPGCCSTEIFPLRTKAGLHPSWLSKFLRRSPIVKELNDSCTGARMPRTSPQAILGLRIPIPPIDEQERIVEVLDEAFAAIDRAKANIERNLTNARELFQIRLNDIFSNPSEDWEVKLLGEVCERITKGSTPTSYGHSFQQEGVNFVKVESLTEDGRFLPSKFAFVSEACHTEFKRSQLREGDILISIAGTLGRTAIVSEDILPANTNQALAIVRLEQGVPINTVKREFVVRFIQNSTEHIASIRSGTAQPNLSLTQLKNFLIPIPPLEEQERIVTELDSLDELKRSLEVKYQTELDNLEELRQSILEQAFEGKLTEPIAA